jgi:CMP-N-acetylneuraminate monooxygenase
MGGVFLPDIEDTSILKCSRHGWKLDPATMEYCNPPGVKHRELLVVWDADGGLSCFEEVHGHPWDEGKRAPATLSADELTFEFWTHACGEIKAGRQRIITDPWVEGPAFFTGWWLIHEPPKGWLQRLASADVVWISHLHSDHLNYHSLRLLFEENPHVRIVVADLPSSVIQGECAKLPFTNIQRVPVLTWYVLDEDTRLMILPDAFFEDMDTALLVDYKGHLVLNLVDCCRPNDDVLPTGVDLLLSAFTAGGSGFPVVYSGGKYTREWILSYMQNENKRMLQRLVEHIEMTGAKSVIPFAGYFTEVSPHDKDVLDLNRKGTAEDAVKHLAKRLPNVNAWAPRVGSVFDISTGAVTLVDPHHPQWRTDFKVDYYNRVVYQDLEHCEALRDEVLMDAMRFYFKWLGFAGYDLILHIVVCDEDFSPDVSIMVDFRDLQFVQERPSREHFYERLLVRKNPWKITMLRGEPWDGIFFGFQVRAFREPDVYHHQFWDHVYTKIPSSLPDWQSFLDSHRASLKGHETESG